MRVLLVLCTCAVAHEVHATEPAPAEVPTKLELVVGAGGAGSAWRTDASVHSSFKLGWRPLDFLSFFFLGRLAYATVDDRMLTFVSAGAELSYPMEPVRPYLRLSAAHQHEESLLNAGPESLLGVGDAVRHRGGMEIAIGTEIPLAEDGDIEIVVRVEPFVDLFLGNAGPSFYAGGTLAVGLNYAL